jgi:hypothetical protein
MTNSPRNSTDQLSLEEGLSTAVKTLQDALLISVKLSGNAKKVLPGYMESTSMRTDPKKLTSVIILIECMINCCGIADAVKDFNLSQLISLKNTLESLKRQIAVTEKSQIKPETTETKKKQASPEESKVKSPGKQFKKNDIIPKQKSQEKSKDEDKLAKMAITIEDDRKNVKKKIDHEEDEEKEFEDSKLKSKKRKHESVTNEEPKAKKQKTLSEKTPVKSNTEVTKKDQKPSSANKNQKSDGGNGLNNDVNDDDDFMVTKENEPKAKNAKTLKKDEEESESDADTKSETKSKTKKPKEITPKKPVNKKKKQEADAEAKSEPSKKPKKTKSEEKAKSVTKDDVKEKSKEKNKSKEEGEESKSSSNKKKSKKQNKNEDEESQSESESTKKGGEKLVELNKSKKEKTPKSKREKKEKKDDKTSKSEDPPGKSFQHVYKNFITGTLSDLKLQKVQTYVLERDEHGNFKNNTGSTTTAVTTTSHEKDKSKEMDISSPKITKPNQRTEQNSPAIIKSSEEAKSNKLVKSPPTASSPDLTLIQKSPSLPSINTTSKDSKTTPNKTSLTANVTNIIEKSDKKTSKNQTLELEKEDNDSMVEDDAESLLTMEEELEEKESDSKSNGQYTETWIGLPKDHATVANKFSWELFKEITVKWQEDTKVGELIKEVFKVFLQFVKLEWMNISNSYNQLKDARGILTKDSKKVLSDNFEKKFEFLINAELSTKIQEKLLKSAPNSYNGQGILCLCREELNTKVLLIHHKDHLIDEESKKQMTAFVSKIHIPPIWNENHEHLHNFQDKTSVHIGINPETEQIFSHLICPCINFAKSDSHCKDCIFRKYVVKMGFYDFIKCFSKNFKHIHEIEATYTHNFLPYIAKGEEIQSSFYEFIKKYPESDGSFVCPALCGQSFVTVESWLDHLGLKIDNVTDSKFFDFFCESEAKKHSVDDNKKMFVNELKTYPLMMNLKCQKGSDSDEINQKVVRLFKQLATLIIYKYSFTFRCGFIDLIAKSALELKKLGTESNRELLNLINEILAKWFKIGILSLGLGMNITKLTANETFSKIITEKTHRDSLIEMLKEVLPRITDDQENEENEDDETNTNTHKVSESDSEKDSSKESG